MHTYIYLNFFQERDSNHEKLQELFEENAQLTLLSKTAINSSANDSDNFEDAETGILCINFLFEIELLRSCTL